VPTVILVRVRIITDSSYSCTAKDIHQASRLHFNSDHAGMGFEDLTSFGPILYNLITGSNKTKVYERPFPGASGHGIELVAICTSLIGRVDMNIFAFEEVITE
jgi:hypothetical protein